MAKPPRNRPPFNPLAAFAVVVSIVSSAFYLAGGQKNAFPYLYAAIISIVVCFVALAYDRRR